MDCICLHGCTIGEQATYKFNNNETSIQRGCPANSMAALIAMVRIIMPIDCLLALQATVFIHY
jgi:hypothetical protein